VIRRGPLKGTVGYVKAVDGVSFAIAPARSLALVGESGCGKTTIGKGILQLLRGIARIEGTASLSGQLLDPLEGEALRRARRQMQIIFRDPFDSPNPRLPVAEVIEDGVASLRPEITPAERRARVVELLQKVGLHADSVNRYPHEFSGGQRQRIARALAVEPNLIICDEPTSALDVSVQKQILNLLAQLQRELGVAYLFITHNFGVVEYLAHVVAMMQAGRIVEAGPAERILEHPRHEYTQTLPAAVPRLARAARCRRHQTAAAPAGSPGDRPGARSRGPPLRRLRLPVPGRSPFRSGSGFDAADRQCPGHRPTRLTRSGDSCATGAFAAVNESTVRPDLAPAALPPYASAGPMLGTTTGRSRRLLPRPVAKARSRPAGWPCTTRACLQRVLVVRE
jgi:ABC-type oligopeptide transport system ATPase subunit